MKSFLKKAMMKAQIMRLCYRSRSKIAYNNIIDKKTEFLGKNVCFNNNNLSSSSIGFGTTIGSDCKILYTKVGKYTSIANNVLTIYGSHPTRDFVSTSPIFYKKNNYAGFTFAEDDIYEEYSYVDKEKRFMFEIGNDVWIGNSVKILDGVKIADGCVIAAGAVVTKDTEPYGVYGGVAAKLIRKRFSDEEIDFLLKLKWWDKPTSWLMEHQKYFYNVKVLMNHIGEQRDA